MLSLVDKQEPVAHRNISRKGQETCKVSSYPGRPCSQRTLGMPHTLYIFKRLWQSNISIKTFVDREQSIQQCRKRCTHSRLRRVWLDDDVHLGPWEMRWFLNIIYWNPDSYFFLRSLILMTNKTFFETQTRSHTSASVSYRLPQASSVRRARNHDLHLLEIQGLLWSVHC